jgi:hypothetical protein
MKDVRSTEEDIQAMHAEHTADEILLDYDGVSSTCDSLNDPESGICKDAVLFAGWLSKNTSLLETNRAQFSMHIRARQILILKGYHGLATWLDGAVTDGFNEMYHLPGDIIREDNRWLHRLINHAKEMVLGRTKERFFDPATYLATSDSQALQSHSVKRRLPYYDDPKESQQAALDIVLEILCAWTGIVLLKDRWRMWALRYIVEAFGTQSLALQATWNVFNVKQAFKIIKHRKLTQEGLKHADLRPFLEALQGML